MNNVQDSAVWRWKIVAKKRAVIEAVQAKS